MRIKKKFIVVLLAFMILDVLIYADIVNSGLLVKLFAEPLPADSSFPDYFGLLMLWEIAHYPTSLLLGCIHFPDNVAWLPVLNDILVVGVLYAAIKLIKAIKKN